MGKIFCRGILFLLAWVWISGAPAGELVLLVTGDLHGELRKLGALAPLLRREAEAVRVDLGDLWQGNYTADSDGGKSMMRALNMLRYDYFLPGNHDFELPEAEFQNVMQSFRGRVLGADWSFGGVHGVPWVLLKKGKFRCVLIGLTDPKMRFRPASVSGDFAAPEKALARVMPEIRSLRPDAVVLAWHSGRYFRGGSMAKVLRRFPEIDLVLGAHTHEETRCARIGGACFMQTGCCAAAAGRVVLEYDDKTGRLKRISTALLRPLPNHCDTEIAALAEQTEKHEALRAQEVLAEPMPPEALGRMWAEKIRKRTGADWGVIQLRRLHTDHSGPWTRRRIFFLLPYRNRIALVRLTAEECAALWRELLRDQERISCFAGKMEGKAGITAALSGHLLWTSPALRYCLEEKRYTLLPLWERDAVQEGNFDNR